MLPGNQILETRSDEAQNFTATHWSVVLKAAGAPSPEGSEALENLCRTYWPPLYAYVRRKGNPPHDAQDLTQGFFARLLSGNYLGTVAPEKGKFRSFLLAALNHFLSDERDRARAIKRGGGKPLVSLDDENAESLYQEEAVSGLTPEQSFEKRWASTVLDQAFQKLRQEMIASNKETLFDQLKPFLAEESPDRAYASIGSALGMSANTVAVAVRRLRQRYRDFLRSEIADTVASPDEVEEELRYLVTVLGR
jgi:RNA polymerase sigma-70 factor (ECF subfamily)